jgi:hypothetical protein
MPDVSGERVVLRVHVVVGILEAGAVRITDCDLE